MGPALSDRFPEGTAVLVTGGAGGVGLAVARALIGQSMVPCLLGRRQDALDEAAAALQRTCATAAGDVTDRPSLQKALEHLREQAGPILGVVHAAGAARSAPTFPPDDDLWDDMLRLNATGTWVVATETLPAMCEAGRGAFVLIGSTASLRGYGYTAGYVAGKHAALGLVRALHEDCGRKGVAVSAVCPGFLDTPMTDKTIERIVAATDLDAAAARASLSAMNASGRLISPEEVADAALALLADPEAGGTHHILE